MLIEQRVTNDSRSVLVAYLLLFFTWGFGVHRMYFGRWGTGIIMLILTSFGWLTALLLIGIPFIGIGWLWAFLDIFLIPGIVEQERDQIRRRMALEYE